MKSNLLLVFILLMAPGFVLGGESRSIDRGEPIANSISKTSKTHNELLFLGNSHSSVNGLPELVATLIETGTAGSTANAVAAPGWKYLSERLDDGVTQQSLKSRAWTHVILQAQKYSSSGLYSYPTDAAEEWIRRAKAQNALPILFPEWPRRGNTEEGQRVHKLHLGISARESACVAPVGLAWEESIARYPTLDLHAADGNHSNLKGALLTAYVFYQLLTGQSAAELPYIREIAVGADIQQNLSVVASVVVESNKATCADVGINIKSYAGIPTLSVWGLFIMVLLMLVAIPRRN